MPLKEIFEKSIHSQYLDYSTIARNQAFVCQNKSYIHISILIETPEKTGK